MFISPFDEKKSFKQKFAFSQNLFLYLHPDMCLCPIIRPGNNCSLRGQVTRYYDTKPTKVIASSKLGNRIEAQARAYGKAISDTIYVPCGHCAECVAAKQNALVQRVQCESKYRHLFFCTLTYDNKHLPVLELEIPFRKDRSLVLSSSQEEVSSGDVPAWSTTDAEQALENYGFGDSITLQDTHYQNPDSGKWLSKLPSGVCSRLEDDDIEYDLVKLPYADIHHIQLLMKNLRDNDACLGRKFSYVAVSELGKRNGRPHFHILFCVEKRDGDYEYVNGRQVVKQSVFYALEKSLYKSVFKYWAVNVGTRKNPVYEKLFTYRKRFLGSKCYTNFDLHYVDPTKTTDGTSNVAYYVTKYIMKASDIERRRQQFLRLNLSESEYRAAYDTIKCRLLISKGLGLDVEYYTTEIPVTTKNPNCSACEYAEFLRDHVLNSDDLPDDVINGPSLTRVTFTKRRVMVPNFELAYWIRKNCTLDVGTKPYPVFVSPDGKHRPLGRYFKRCSYIFGTMEFLDIYLNFEDRYSKPQSFELSREEITKIELRHQKRLKAIENNSDFDTSPALLWGTDSEDNNSFTVYGY